MKKRRYAAVTMVRDETVHLKLWYNYYSKEFGSENIYIIDHNSQRHRPNDVLNIATNVTRLPFTNPVADPTGELRKFDQVRFEFISNKIQGLLKYYDCVVFNDVDEQFIVDSDNALGLRDYLDSLPDIGIRCGVGIELFQKIGQEQSLKLDMPLFQQRRFFRYNLHFCKPWIISKPTQITGHGAFSPFHIDPKLILVHLHWIDLEITFARQKDRIAAFEEGRGGERSRWKQTLETKKDYFTELSQRQVCEDIFPHYDFLNTLFPDYQHKEFSEENYKKVRGKRFKTLEVTQFIQPDIKRKLDEPIYKIPDRFLKLNY